MTQKQFFSLFICCILVVSTQCFDCFMCNSVHHENCTMDWTEEEVNGPIFEEYIEQCTPQQFCTQKIVFKNGTRSVWRYCEVHTFDGCNDQKDSCMFHCTTRRCNGVFSDWLPLTKEQAMEHVYMGMFLNILL